jgi:hypothetical protein
MAGCYDLHSCVNLSKKKGNLSGPTFEIREKYPLYLQGTVIIRFQKSYYYYFIYVNPHPKNPDTFFSTPPSFPARSVRYRSQNPKIQILGFSQPHIASQEGLIDRRIYKQHEPQAILEWAHLKDNLEDR